LEGGTQQGKTRGRRGNGISGCEGKSGNDKGGKRNIKVCGSKPRKKRNTGEATKANPNKGKWKNPKVVTQMQKLKKA